MLEQISDFTSGGPDVVIECAGNSKAVELAVNLPKRGGRVIIFGLSGKKDTVNINLQDFFLKELSIKGSLLNPFTFSRSVELLVNKKIQAGKLKAALSPLEELKDILSSPRKSTIIKHQITPN
jgi:threonine dehydrogenase-like Zn-dependent dehydrogenase